VIVDFRTESLDFVPDLLGWVLVAVAAHALGLRSAAWAAGAAAVLSTGDAFLPYHYVLIDPLTNEAVPRCPTDLPPGLACPERIQFDPVAGWRFAAVGLAATAGTFAVVALLWGLRRRALTTGDRSGAVRLALLAGAVVGAWYLPQVLGIASALRSDPIRYDPVWNGAAEYASLVGWLAMAWVAGELCLRSATPWAVPSHVQRSSPWELRAP
jgi:hypothetical protein